MANNPYVNKVVKEGTTLIDISSDTVSPSSLAQGYTAHDASGAQIVGTMTGGGSVTQDQDGYIVLPEIGDGGGTATDEVAAEFYDYDGTLLHSYTKSEFSTLSAMPANPDHTDDGLTSQGWNWTLVDAKEYLQTRPHLTIGQMYVPTDGKSHFFITTTESNEKIQFYYSLKQTTEASGYLTIEWGDGTEPYSNYLISSSGVEHVYENIGDYEIVVYGKEWCTNSVSMGSGFNLSYNFLANVQALRKAYIGNDYYKEIRGFSCNAKLESITFPMQNYTTASNYTFQHCYSLKHFTVPSGSTTMGSYILNDCISLSSISLPKSLVQSGELMSYCPKIKYVDLPPSLSKIGSLSYMPNLKYLYLPDGITYHITSGTMNLTTCVSLRTIENLRNSGFKKMSFSGCSQLDLQPSMLPATLVEVSFASNQIMKYAPSLVNITSLPSSMFSSCYNLTGDIIIPSGITKIPSSCFNSCYFLNSISLPSTLTSIDNAAFSNCWSLESITIPDSVTSLGGSMFSYCYSLKTVNIPQNQNITVIPSSLFYDCGRLQSVLTIPASVTSIGSGAFSNCKSMLEYHILPTTPPTLATNVFYGINADCKIYVPAESLTAYQTATNWSTYASYMVGE